jgi:DNA-binding transcriptional ArsR family regulator
MASNSEKTHVRNLIAASKGLPLGPRSVLAEVCAMCEYAGSNTFYAGNASLANTLGLTQPKVSAHLRMLERAGLLIITGSGNGERRVIVPSRELTNHYRNGKGLPQEEAVKPLTALLTKMYNRYRNDKGLIKPQSKNHYRNDNGTVTESISDPYRNDKVTLTESVTNPYRNGKHNSIEEERLLELEKQLELLKVDFAESQANEFAANAALTEVLDSLESEQAENAKLNARLEKALAVYAQQQEKIAALEAELLARPKAAQTRGRAKKEPAETCPVFIPARDYFEAEYLRQIKVPYRFDGGKDAKALRAILDYLYKELGGNDWDAALAMFQQIVANWQTFPKFYREGFSIYFFNSQINGILKQVSKQFAGNHSAEIDISDLI